MLILEQMCEICESPEVSMDYWDGVFNRPLSTTDVEAARLLENVFQIYECVHDGTIVGVLGEYR